MRCFMKRLVTATAVVWLACAMVRPASADLTYNLVNDPIDQAGYTLSGSITTDGTIGQLTASDILAWNFNLGPYYDVGDSYPWDNPEVILNNVIATSTQIILPDTSSLFRLEDVFYNYGAGGYFDGSILNWDRQGFENYENYSASFSRITAWDNWDPQGFGPEWVIATINTPEPSSAMIVALVACSAGIFHLARWRRVRGKGVPTLDSTSL